MKFPLSRRWTPEIYKKVQTNVKLSVLRAGAKKMPIPNGQTMPDIASIPIGGAKRMDAAILFFDLESFTTITAELPMERALELLNYVIPSVMLIVRHWGGFFEKNTGDGVMAILGTETDDLGVIARDAIECAMAIRYVMSNDIQPALSNAGLPNINFRVGIDMDTVLIGKIGIHSHNFLSAVGTTANLACKLQSYARPNGICIGEFLARNLHSDLHQFCEEGEHPDWKWQKAETGHPYHFYHFHHYWPEPTAWVKSGFVRQLLK